MNPIELSRAVEERYRRYLKTTFYFKDPELRASFEDALNSARLSKGPYLEATPVFKQVEKPPALFQSLLGFQPDGAFLDALKPERHLWQHQKEAIVRVFAGRNVVVATGTGSGKTEAFLYPILLHLYQEFHTGKLCPGVRALILYPMNALANDQRDRLGEICERLQMGNSPFRFTFGQYIGETPEDKNDSKRHASDHLSARKPGESVLRSEMRDDPPHILLTNYSMLEYLLLRPDDSRLFDNGRAKWWTFLALDEAHQYRGSRGIEMAMLVRRLKRRLREGGRSEPFRCIATSATLVGEQEDRSAVANFASDLFGEEFKDEDVILGECEPVAAPSLQRLSAPDYRLLTNSVHENDTAARTRLANVANKLGVKIPSGEGILRSVGILLQQDNRAAKLRRLITGNPAEVGKIAAKVFDDLPQEARVPALSELVELLLQARDTRSDAPLLSARYHLFLRSLEGAFVSNWPQKKVFLDRRAGQGGIIAFEVGLCRECGQHYFVGQKDLKGNKLLEPIRDPSHLNFGATFWRPIESDGNDIDEDDINGAGGRQVFRLCARCGELGQGQLKCGHEDLIRVVKEAAAKDEDRADQMARCGVCGYNAAGRDPVREVVHGSDGPNAVTATTLYQRLPDQRKKVLAFADSRQEAAFFAWYLEDTYKDILARNLLVKVVQKLGPHAPEGLSLRELAVGLRDVFRDRGIFPPATGNLDLMREAWKALCREFLTDEPRISLEGVGLVRWSFKWPGWLQVPEVLRDLPWSLSEQEARGLVSILLDSMRTDRAIELRTDGSVSLSWSDLRLQASQMRVRIGGPQKAQGVRSWDGKRGKRARLLAKLLTNTKAALPEEKALEQAVTALRAVWETLTGCDKDAPSSLDRVLVAADDARRVNPDWWRLSPIPSDGVIFQCGTCGRLQTVSVRAVCPRHPCPGRLEEIRRKDLEANHYRLLYEEDLPGPPRVEEHTAQLDKEKAREFQRDFKAGKIHVLSCSTTFELGVDLGDLDTIFLRNVPPEAFNYAQRVGRAGRRSGYPGFAITYCRRGPHDLYHFSEPELMLRGKIRPPALGLRNDKIIKRHIAAVALSRFFRAYKQRFENVERLFNDLRNPTGVADFKAFLQKHRNQLEESLRATVPPEMTGPVGLDDGSWITKITGDESRLSLAEAEVSSDYQAVQELEAEAAQKGGNDTAKWAKARAKTIAEEDVLSFLSRKAVIPKYGFPVDVVELDIQRAHQSQEAFEILLQRDLSIAVSEFAPTSKLVANKKVWTSYGLKKVAGKEWDRWCYARCAKHNRLDRKPWRPGSPPPSFAKCCPEMKADLRYVDPKFGFVTSRDKPEEPKARPARVFTTRPYFVGFKDGEGQKIPFGVLTLTKVSPGCMVVLCEGRRGSGFYVCGGCGAGFRKYQKPPHKTPYGRDCHEPLEQWSLGHEFVTDVLQIQFHPKPEPNMEPVWFAYSLAYALVEGAASDQVLQVPSNDLSATVGYGIAGHAIPPIILYDNVPGGAGLVARLENEKLLKACLEASRQRVGGKCGCDEETSCYGCLRSYRNQFAHQFLRRGPVMCYLEAVLSEWKRI